MAIVAVVGLLLGCGLQAYRWTQLSLARLSRAAHCSEEALLWTATAYWRGHAGDQAGRERALRFVAHFDRMEQKWREGARRPWLAVPPDPREPRRPR